MKKTMLLAQLTIPALLVTGAFAVAASNGLPPRFPVYPHASDPAAGHPEAAGRVPGYVRQSHDSQTTVDGWYHSKLPASCQRVALPEHAIEYRCRAARVFVDIIYDGDNVDIHAYPV